MSKRYRTYATTLFTPARHTRRERHVRSQAAGAIVMAARRRAKDEKHSRAKALADEREMRRDCFQIFMSNRVTVHGRGVEWRLRALGGQVVA